jgi:intracellular sulfur oxidation DsrE/DsrF family protein
MARIMKSIVVLAAIFGLAGLTGCANQGKSASADAPTKVVYHVNDSAEASAALRNIKNHLKADPKAQITVVTHSKGIDFLLDGATDKNGNPYNIPVEELMAKGVKFDVCNNTLVGRKIDPKTVIPGAVIVPSGVAEVAKLQAKEGYVYVKP